MISKKIREEFEANYPMPFACGWNSMTNEYQCIWDEHAGEEEVEAAIEQHNDRLSVWAASRQAVSITLPDRLFVGHGNEECWFSEEKDPEKYSDSYNLTNYFAVVEAIKNQGLKVKQ